ncbi:MAG: hypothetical protein JSR58_03350 [Verrucomicrobia bacterium]|nr:hypothetical protein [Verrucomicrobiota bacterium]
MTTLFQRVGPLVQSSVLSSWHHASLSNWKLVSVITPKSFTPFLPYQSIFVLSIALVCLYVAKDGKPEFSFFGKNIHIIDVSIQSIEILADTASAAAAVALIVLGQPVIGGCTIAFLIIQVAGRRGFFNQPMNAPLEENADFSLAKKVLDPKADPINTDEFKTILSQVDGLIPGHKDVETENLPWAVQKTPIVNAPAAIFWKYIPKDLRYLFLQQDYQWSAKLFGLGCGTIVASNFMEGIDRLGKTTIKFSGSMIFNWLNKKAKHRAINIQIKKLNKKIKKHPNNKEYQAQLQELKKMLPAT